jgi:hypothetical protein
MPLLVKRSSGSSTRLPTMVVWLFRCHGAPLLTRAGQRAAVAALAVRIDGGRASSLQVLAASVAVADLCGQGWVLAASVIGLAGGDPLAGLAVGREPAAANIEVAGWLGHLTCRAALGYSRRRPRGDIVERAPGGRGLVSGFVCGTYRVLLGRGGISWHERRACVLGRAPDGGGLVCGFVSGRYSVLLGRGGLSWHERRAGVRVRWLLAG